MSYKGYGTVRIVIPVSLAAFFLLLSTSFLGIPLNDDSLYLAEGAHVRLSWLITHHDWGTLYDFWFKLLGIFCHDPVRRYFLSWTLLILLIALIPTLFRMRAAWLYTLIILTLPITTDGPFVGLFASTMVLTGLCWLLHRRPSFAEAAFAACVLSFCMTFSRPEYNYGVLICTAATIVAVIAEWLTTRLSKTARPVTPSTIPAWLMLLLVITLFAATIALIAAVPSHRSGMAFAQHFNIRAAFRGEIPLTPNTWRSNYAELRFGVDTTSNAADGSATIGEFFRANPRLFLQQILDNLTDRYVIFLLALVIVVVLLPWLRKDTASLRPASLFVLLVCLPPLAGIIVIFPHNHYAAILLPALTIFALQVLNPERWLRPSSPWMLVPAVLIPGFALLGYLYVARPHMQGGSASFERLNLHRIQCIRQWDQSTADTNPSVFSVSEILPVYIDESRKLVFPSALPAWDQFQSWAAQTQPAWISVDTLAFAPYGYTPLATQYGISPEQLSAFLQNDLGYTPHPCQADAQLTVYTHNKG